jgi:cytochrome P450
MSTDVLRTPPRAIAAAARSSVSDLWRPVATGAYRDIRRPRAQAASPGLPRTTFDPTLPDNIANPYPALERIREHPVVVNERLGVWMLGRHDDVHAAARNSEALSSRDGITLRGYSPKVVLLADPPDHTRLRRVVAPAFTKRAVNQLASDIEALADESIAALRSGEVVDLVNALTVPMPINVIAAILGVPRQQWPAFREVSNRFAQVFAPRSLLEVTRTIGSSLQGYLQMHALMESEMRRRTTHPAEDLLTRLQVGRANGELSASEAFLYSVILLVAGNETTTNLLGMLLMRMAQDQDLFDALKADRELVPNAVEEAARWGSPVQWVTRVATRPYEVGGTVIPAGGRVMLLYASANRDPDKFPEPDRLDVHRDTTGHLAFGHGLHFCLGAHLARLETITAVNHLLDAVDGFEVAGPVRWGTTPSLQGPATLPVRIRRRL